MVEKFKERVPMGDLRCYTIHYFYRVEGAEIFNGLDGYVEQTANKAINIPSIEKDISVGEGLRKGLAEYLGVPVSQVVRISRDKYLENVLEGDELYCNFIEGWGDRK